MEYMDLPPASSRGTIRGRGTNEMRARPLSESQQPSINHCVDWAQNVSSTEYFSISFLNTSGKCVKHAPYGKISV